MRIRLPVRHEVGLHARPAALFVSESNKYQANIRVRNATKESSWVNAKSILGVLTLGVEQNHEVIIEAEGQDEAEAIEGLQALITGNFTP